MNETKLNPNFRRFIMTLSTWFGCGKIPKAPGTMGSLGAIPLVWLFSLLGPLPYMGLTIVFSVASIWIAHFHEAITGAHDCSEVVIDEVAGMLVTMAWIPFSWPYVLLGFLLFRAFDVVKPFPISYVDKKIGGGVGAVGDDLIAGILSNIILQIVLQKGLLP